MATMNVSISDQMKEWVNHQSNDGRYSNASDYVRDLIRRDQARQQAIASLQSAIDKGMESGIVGAFDPVSFKLKMRDKHIVR
jgi:antitoxin ParD1/3/4